jgi:hypothetical protein
MDDRPIRYLTMREREAMSAALLRSKRVLGALYRDDATTATPPPSPKAPEPAEQA